jgi:hypothetical protein
MSAVNSDGDLIAIGADHASHLKLVRGVRHAFAEKHNQYARRYGRPRRAHPNPLRDHPISPLLQYRCMGTDPLRTLITPCYAVRASHPSGPSKSSCAPLTSRSIHVTWRAVSQGPCILARLSLTSACHGTADLLFNAGFCHQEWRAPSLTNSQPCPRRCLRSSTRFTRRSSLLENYFRPLL